MLKLFTDQRPKKDLLNSVPHQGGVLGILLTPAYKKSQEDIFLAFFNRFEVWDQLRYSFPATTRNQYGNSRQLDYFLTVTTEKPTNRYRSWTFPNEAFRQIALTVTNCQITTQSTTTRRVENDYFSPMSQQGSQLVHFLSVTTSKPTNRLHSWVLPSEAFR